MQETHVGDGFKYNSFSLSLYICLFIYLFMLAPVLGAREKTCIFANMLIIM